MKVVPLEKTDLTVAKIAEMARGGSVILTRRGKPLATVNDVSGVDWEALSLANDPRFRAIIEESRRSYREKGGIALRKVRTELGLQRDSKTRKKKP